MRSRLSVIVCTMNRARELARFLDSLLAQTRYPRELVVVDASPDDRTMEMLGRMGGSCPFPIIAMKDKPSTAFQRNHGFLRSTGAFVVFFDDDVVLEPECIKEFEKAFCRYENCSVAGITGRITNVPDSKPLPDRLFKRVFLLSDSGRGKIKASGMPEHPGGEHSCFTEVVYGCCMGFYRDVFDRHAFDETLTGYAYMEDVDISRRISATMPFVYEPGARLAHLSRTHAGNTRELRRRLLMNHWYLFMKNSSKDLPHLLAFAWSVAGIFAYNALLARDPEALKGLADAARTILKQRMPDAGGKDDTHP
ncbi:MAG: glycosyltransferase family 2 protein [Desulfatibacillaceae bacterium]